MDKVISFSNLKSLIKSAIRQPEEIDCQAKEKINAMINVDISIKKGLFVMDNEKVHDIIRNTRKKLYKK